MRKCMSAPSASPFSVVYLRKRNSGVSPSSFFERRRLAGR
jgi:hypothetical protein